MKMDDDKACGKLEQKSATDYGFFRESVCSGCATALCFFYEAVEASMMGG